VALVYTMLALTALMVVSSGQAAATNMGDELWALQPLGDRQISVLVFRVHVRPPGKEDSGAPPEARRLRGALLASYLKAPT
jgi:hypothetical protein